MVGWGRGCAHEEVGRVTVSKNLSKLLEIDLIIAPDINELEEIFNLLILW